jgi:hypothetical protein
MRLRRFAVVGRKPLKTLVWWFAAAVLRWLRWFTRKWLMKHGAAVLQWLRCGTPIPPMRFAAPLARAAGA